MKNFLKIAFFSVFVTAVVIAAYAIIYKTCISNDDHDDASSERRGPEIVENISNDEIDLNQEDNMKKRNEIGSADDTNQPIADQQ